MGKHGDEFVLPEGYGDLNPQQSFLRVARAEKLPDCPPKPNPVLPDHPLKFGR
jgi:hypothetical protein